MAKEICNSFEQIVTQYPTNIAVKFGEQSLSYRELNHKVNQLAHYLSRDNKPGNLIAILLPPSIGRIIAVLAVLKSGCAYIPLDPDYPKLRIDAMLANSQAAMLITQTSWAHKITADFPIKVLAIDQEQSLIDKHSMDNLAIEIDPENLACVIYTSGTTGIPKGVCIPHRAIHRLVVDTNYIHIQPHHRITQSANFAFDAVLFEIWGALLNGATLVIVAKETLLDFKILGQFLQSEKINILFLTTSLFSQMAVTLPEIFRNLDYLLIGGEALNPTPVRALLNCPRGCPQHILNCYGPTENTTFSVIYWVKNVNDDAVSIPIGKPVAGTQCYVLDKKLKPTTEGELYLGGENLALGYLNQPQLTAEKFHDQLYKTGDHVRWLEDGNLDYIGRIDNQIKIRGFRIELEEITSHLWKHPNIVQAEVIVLQNARDDKQLVAYVTIKDKTSPPTVDELQHFLAQSLPNYMVPNIYVWLNNMPLTANGKIDRNHLPHPEVAQLLRSSDQFQEPQTASEKILTQIWRKAFKLKKIGIHDQFFTLGGHSLLITKILLTIKAKLNRDISFLQFHQHPTIHELANFIDQETQGKDQALLKMIKHDANLANYEIPTVELQPASLTVENILLTGATGFVGAHLLLELLKKTTANVYCLARGENEAGVLRRIKQAFAKYELDKQYFSTNRIIPVQGDFNESSLGLDRLQYERLSQIIDAIYHNGAYVHHVYPYPMLRAANVLSTVELVKIARIHKIKAIHYVSTIGTASKVDDSGQLAEDFPDAKIIESEVGYYQSKWVAERLLTQLNALNHPVIIYRLGRITGQSKTGICSFERDHFQLFVKGCLQMGAAPDIHKPIDMAPVNLVAQMMVELSLHSESLQQVFHLYNDHFIDWVDYMKWLQQQGFKIDLLSYEAWLQQLEKASPDNALYPLIPFYLEKDYSLLTIEDSHNHLPANLKTKKSLAKYHLQFPALDEQLLRIYLRYLSSC